MHVSYNLQLHAATSTETIDLWIYKQPFFHWATTASKSVSYKDNWNLYFIYKKQLSYLWLFGRIRYVKLEIIKI